MSALSDAVRDRDVPKVKLLLDEGVEPWERGGALGVAIRAKPLDAALLDLLVVGADAQIAASSLWLAVANRVLPAVQRLLAAGAPASVDADEERSPLHTAARNGDLEIVRALLDGGAAIDHVGGHGQGRETRDGHNALFAAIEGKHVDVVRLLVERGADVNLLSRLQRCPLDLARAVGDAAIVAILEQAGARPVTPDRLDLAAAVQVDARERVRQLLSEATPAARRAALLVGVVAGFEGAGTSA